MVKSFRVLAAVGLVLIGLAGGSSGATPQVDPTPLPHKIAVDARGPLALVEVTRMLATTKSESGGAEALLDLAFPERSTLVAIEVQDQGRWRSIDSAEAAYAADLYRSESSARGVTPAYEPFDESALHRIRIARAAGPRASAPLPVRYRFSTQPAFANGRYHLRFPPAPERFPSPADVTIQTRDGADVEIAGARLKTATAVGRASTRGGWEITWAPRDAAASGEEASLATKLALAPLSATESGLAFDVRSRPGRPSGPPTSVLFVVDRSRSVGPAGLSAERDLARRILEGLPPDTRFDAVFFDRSTKRLFPMSRPATRESIESFEREMVTDRLANGTDPALALHDAGDLLRREQAAFGPRVLLAFLTDGALPEKVDGPTLDRALGKLPGLDLSIAAFAIRPADEDPMSPQARQALQQLVAERGGVARELRVGQIGDVVPVALADLERGGDLVAVRLALEGRDRQVAETLAPGTAISGVALLAGFRGRSSGSAQIRVTYTYRGKRVTHPIAATAIPSAWRHSWVSPTANGDPPKARLLVAKPMVVLVEPVLHPAAAPEPVVKGSMDRIVMRNVLSLAYMPRARACYLNRSGATPAQRELTGKVRLALDVVRGEVERTTIESSTLGHPEVETCLQEGAFAIDVPRAWRSDAPVTAILNMNFRPHTPDKKRAADLGEVGDQIDLLIEEAQRQAQTPEAKPSPPLPTR